MILYIYLHHTAFRRLKKNWWWWEGERDEDGIATAVNSNPPDNDL